MLLFLSCALVSSCLWFVVCRYVLGCCWCCCRSSSSSSSAWSAASASSSSSSSSSLLLSLPCLVVSLCSVSLVLVFFLFVFVFLTRHFIVYSKCFVMPELVFRSWAWSEQMSCRPLKLEVRRLSFPRQTPEDGHQGGSNGRSFRVHLVSIFTHERPAFSWGYQCHCSCSGWRLGEQRRWARLPRNFVHHLIINMLSNVSFLSFKISVLFRETT